jgi:hypothetical protein
MQRMKWMPEEFLCFDFYIKKDGNVPKIAGGYHRLSDAECAKRINEIAERQIYHPEKGDLGTWGPGVTFHFIRD